MIDLFTLSPNDRRAVDALIDRLAAHCDTAQVEQFLHDLAHWHRIQHRRVSAHAYQDAKRALEEWQDYINRLPELTS
jgi:hypothetical protein